MIANLGGKDGSTNIGAFYDADFVNNNYSDFGFASASALEAALDAAGWQVQGPSTPSMAFYEAEDMELNGFSIETNSAASGGQLIGLSSNSGTAITTLNVNSGYYDIETAYFDESDGNAVYKLFLDGDLIDAWSANRDLGLADPVAGNRLVHTTKSIYLSSGRTLELLAYTNGCLLYTSPSPRDA